MVAIIHSPLSSRFVRSTTHASKRIANQPEHTTRTEALHDLLVTCHQLAPVRAIRQESHRTLDADDAIARHVEKRHDALELAEVHAENARQAHKGLSQRRLCRQLARGFA